MRVHASVSREEMPYNGQLQEGGFNVMFWGCFSKFGLGPLVALEGVQNQDTYIELLQNYVLPEIETAREIAEENILFTQDNAPCHKAKRVVTFLENNDIQTLNWPPQSPDLNPIENLWAWIKRKHESEYPFPTTRFQLIENIFEKWGKIPEEIVVNLCDSVKRRLGEVLRLNGRPTKY
jgi:transposase